MATSINASKVVNMGDSSKNSGSTENAYSQINTDESSSQVVIDLANFNQNQKQLAQPKINPEMARFPYCIVWTPLPMISWFLPFIGHTGIAMSNGIIHDFAGPYYIEVDNLSFGETHK